MSQDLSSVLSWQVRLRVPCHFLRMAPRESSGLFYPVNLVAKFSSTIGVSSSQKVNLWGLYESGIPVIMCATTRAHVSQVWVENVVSI